MQIAGRRTAPGRHQQVVQAVQQPRVGAPAVEQQQQENLSLEQLNRGAGQQPAARAAEDKLGKGRQPAVPTAAAPPSPSAAADRQLVVSCTNVEDVEGVRRCVVALGGRMDEGRTACTAAVTHLVMGKEAQTTGKALSACILHAWLMPESWLRDSAQAGRLLDEAQHGLRYSERPFDGVRVAFDPRLWEERQREQLLTLQDIIALGGGKMVMPDRSHQQAIDVVVIPSKAEDECRRTWTRPKLWLWEDFMVGSRPAAAAAAAAAASTSPACSSSL